MNSDGAPSVPAGYTQADLFLNFSEVVVAAKIAAGGETSVSSTISPSASWNIFSYEFSGNAASAAADQVVHTNTASGTAIPTGTTATLTGSSDLAVAVYGNDGNEAASAVDSSYTLGLNAAATGTSSPVVSSAVAYKFLTGTAGTGCTFTIAGGAGNLTAGVSTFQGAGGAAAPIPTLVMARTAN